MSGSAPGAPFGPPSPPAPSFWKPVLIAGGVFGVLEVIPVFMAANLCCCMPLLACGVVAAWLHGRAMLAAGLPMSVGLGAGVGAVAGLVSAIVTTTIDAMIVLAAGAEAPERIEENMREAAERLPFGGGADALRAMPEGWTLVVIVLVAQLFLHLLLFTGFGTLGGVLGGALMQKRQPRPLAASDEPPPPPKLFE